MVYTLKLLPELLKQKITLELFRSKWFTALQELVWATQIDLQNNKLS